MTMLPLPRDPVPLGTSGMSAFPLAWGMWRLSGSVNDARAKVAAALDIGVNLFDTADIYSEASESVKGGAETLFGEVLRAEPGWRQRIIVASKGGIVPGIPYDSSPAHLQNACEGSLRRLGVECLDLYQIHRPDLLTHPEQVAATLERLHRDGKIRAVGVSNYTAPQLQALQSWLPVPIVSHQVEFSPLCLGPLTDGLFDQAMERKMALLAWSPLAGGRLAESRNASHKITLLAELDHLARREGQSRAAIALAWIMTHPSRPIPLIGSQEPDHIRQFGDVFSVRINRREWYRVLVAASGEKLP